MTLFFSELYLFSNLFVYVAIFGSFNFIKIMLDGMILIFEMRF